MGKQGLREVAKLCLKHMLKDLQTRVVSEPQRLCFQNELKSLSQSFTGNDTH